MPRRSQEEKLEAKRLAEQRRRAKTKSNPELHAVVKAKARARRRKNKAEGKIIPICEMTSEQKKKVRQRNCIYSKHYRQKKRNCERTALVEDLIPCENPVPENNPLSSPPSSPPQLARPLSPKLSDLMTGLIPLSRPYTRLSKKLNLKMCHVNQNMSCLKSKADDLLLNTETEQISPRPGRSNPLTRIESFSSDDENISSCSSLPVSPVNSCGSGDDSSSTQRATYEDKVNESMMSKAAGNRKRKHQRKLNFNAKIMQESKLMHKRIQELKALNCKYRKQLSRMKKTVLAMKYKSGFNTDVETTTQNEESESTVTDTTDSEDGNLKKDVECFFLDDENSRMCAGKRDSITKKKDKRQKRYLTDTMQNIHKKFLHNFPDHKISYSQFCKLRPFWVLIPSLRDRDTCMCKLHANMELLINSLRQHNIISENTPTKVLKAMCCDATNLTCLSRKCNVCKNKTMHYNEFNNSNTIYYYAWKRSPVQYVKNGQIRTTLRTIKEKTYAAPMEVIKEFGKQLDPYMHHCRNIISQNAHVKKIKNNLREHEAIVHCDFSENYGVKYGQEIQAFHFGSSRTQITLHTVVIYFISNEKLETKSFCTFSKCLRHDAVAIWAHLIPVLSYIESNAPTVNSTHFISDSPSAQYRNRKMFYIMSKLYWNFTNLVFVSWNYSESGHGKGAPDGVGGTLKRTADQFVARGFDIPNLETLMNVLKQNVKVIIIEEVEESCIFEKDMLMRNTLPNFRGSMQTHQVIWDRNKIDILAMRKLSCSLDECATSSILCQHGQHIGIYNLQTSTAPDTFTNTNKKSAKESGVKIISNVLIKLPVHHQQEHQVSNKPGTSFGNESVSNVGPSKDLSLPHDDSFWCSVSSVESDYAPVLSNIVLSTLNDKEDDILDDDDDLRIF